MDNFDLLSLASSVSAATGASAENKEAMQLLAQIVEAESARPSESTSDFSPSDLLPYLKAIRFHQEHRWFFPTAVGLMVAGMIAIPYYLGRRKR